MNEPNSEAPRITQGGFPVESAFAFQFQGPTKDEKPEEKPQPKESAVNTQDLEEAHHRIRDLTIRFDLEDPELGRELGEIADLIYRNLR